MNSKDFYLHHIPETNLIIDGFKHRQQLYPDRRNVYILTHFHSDHYAGIIKRWTFGRVYCSEVTYQLVKWKFKLSDDILVSVNDGEVVCFPEWDFSFQMVEANHCPGSRMVIIWHADKVYLHTGDCRFHPPEILKENALHPFVKPSARHYIESIKMEEQKAMDKSFAEEFQGMEDNLFQILDEFDESTKHEDMDTILEFKTQESIDISEFEKKNQGNHRNIHLSNKDLKPHDALIKQEIKQVKQEKRQNFDNSKNNSKDGVNENMEESFSLEIKEEELFLEKSEVRPNEFDDTQSANISLMETSDLSDSLMTDTQKDMLDCSLINNNESYNENTQDEMEDNETSGEVKTNDIEHIIIPSHEKLMNCPSELVFDKIYLDTTYCNPNNIFPSQSHAMNFVAKVVSKKLKFARENNKRILVIVGSYTIGKERIVKAIADRCGCKIYAKANKLQILQLLNLPYIDLFVNDPISTPIHFVDMSDLHWKRIREIMGSFQSVDEFIVIKPSAMMKEANPPPPGHAKVSKSKKLTTILIPYSEHSSFHELRKLVDCFNVKEIVPTVYSNREHYLTQLQYLTESFNIPELGPIPIPESLLPPNSKVKGTLFQFMNSTKKEKRSKKSRKYVESLNIESNALLKNSETTSSYTWKRSTTSTTTNSSTFSTSTKLTNTTSTKLDNITNQTEVESHVERLNQIVMGKKVVKKKKTVDKEGAGRKRKKSQSEVSMKRQKTLLSFLG